MITSELETPAARFLSVCLQQALEDSWLTPESFAEEFPPHKLMSALEPAKELRSKLLVEAAGVHEKIAPKKSTSAAAEDLQIALEEGICTPQDLLDLVSVDEHVRHLETAELWELLTRDQFWLSAGPRERARLHFMLEAGLEQELIDLSKLLSSIQPERLAKDLPRELVELLLSNALKLGLDASPLDPAGLMALVSLETWLEHISLDHVWETAIAEIAGAAGFAAAPAPVAPEPEKNSTKKEAATKAAPETKKRERTQTAVASPAPPAVNAAPAPAATEAEAKARAQAIEKLTSLERLPLRPDELATPVLLALEALYADLLSLEDDDERGECIDDAFPNEAMKTEALMALAEVLDPRLTKSELTSRGVDAAGLRQLILFEERRRSNRAAGISPSVPPAAPGTIPSSSPPPVSSVSTKSGASVPPPLPAQAARRASVPPPPLPAQATRRGR